MLLPFNEATYTKISNLLICSQHCASVPPQILVNITNDFRCDYGSK